VAEDETAEASDAPAAQAGGIKRKNLIIIGVITALVWAFVIQTGSTVLLIIAGVLTAALAAVLIWAFRMIRKQRGLVGLLQGATESPEARKSALEKLSGDKDASSPTKIFARAQLMAQDDPKGALKLLEPVTLTTFPAAMQDDVSLLKAQLFLSFGRTQDARKCADSMNLDNPDRKEIRPYAAGIVAEAWGRTGKSKEALALLETVELPKKNAEQIAIQMKIARVFARFAANQRGPARADLLSLAEEDVNYLGRFLSPQFRVHPELQKLARSVLEQHPGARKMAKSQQRSQKRG
jgi:hypothetical protein